MADRNLKSPENVPGRYYVDETCIAAKFCVATAPRNFRLSETGYAYLYKQPETPEEEEECRQAVAGCPVSAIGDDGEGE